MDDLLKVDDVGQVIAESIYEYFRDEANIEVISRLKGYGLRLEMDEGPEKLSAVLEGMTIVISGNFSIPRDEMKALIVAHGGKNSGSISRKTTYLLAGEKAGPEKLKKAEARDVAVIGERDFMEMLSMTAEGHVTEDNEPTLF